MSKRPRMRAPNNSQTDCIMRRDGKKKKRRTQLTQLHRVQPAVDIQDEIHLEGFGLAMQPDHCNMQKNEHLETFAQRGGEISLSAHHVMPRKKADRLWRILYIYTCRSGEALYLYIMYIRGWITTHDGWWCLGPRWCVRDLFRFIIFGMVFFQIFINYFILDFSLVGRYIVVSSFFFKWIFLDVCGWWMADCWDYVSVEAVMKRKQRWY